MVGCESFGGLERFARFVVRLLHRAAQGFAGFEDRFQCREGFSGKIFGPAAGLVDDGLDSGVQRGAGFVGVHHRCYDGLGGLVDGQLGVRTAVRVGLGRDLFGNTLVFGCFGGELDGALGGADWEAWEDSLECAAEAVHVGRTAGCFGRKVNLKNKGKWTLYVSCKSSRKCFVEMLVSLKNVQCLAL